MNGARVEDPARFRLPLQPRRDVDALAEDVRSLVDHVAQVDAHAVAESVGVLPEGGVVDLSLHLQGGRHRVHRRRENEEKAVSHRIRDSASVLGRDPVHQGEVPFEGAVGFRFVFLGDAGKADDVREDDRREASLTARLHPRIIARRPVGAGLGLN